MFKKGEIVYCIDTKTFYSNTRSPSLDILKLNIPYTIENPNGGSNDILLKEINEVYYNSKRFISEREYKTISRVDKILKIKDRIHG